MKIKTKFYWLSFLIINLFLLHSCSVVEERPAIPSSPLKFIAYNETHPRGSFIENVTEEKKELIIQEVSLPALKDVSKEKALKDKFQEEVSSLEEIKVTEEKVIVNANNLPLFEFLLYVLGETLKVPFVVEEGVKNLNLPLTLRTPEPLPGREVLKMVIEVLEKNDLKVSTKSGAIYIYRPKMDKTVPPQKVGIGIEALPSGISTAVQIVPLKYVRAQDLVSIIAETYRGTVTLKVFPKENSLLIAGSGAQINTIMEFIKTIDQPYFGEKHMLYFRLNFLRPEEFIKLMSEILIAMGLPIAKTQNEPGVFLISVKHQSGVIAIVPDEKSKELLTTWAKKLDTYESVGTEERIFTYAPLYARASDLVETIKRLFTGQTSTPAIPSGKSPLTSIQPLSEVKTLEPQRTLEQRAISPSVEKAFSRDVSLTLESLKITSDDKRNLVITITTPANYRMILELFKELDKPPRQVLIETMIAEVTLKDDLRYGVEWYIRNRMMGGIYTIQTLEKLGVSTTAGLVYQFVADTETFKALINLFAQRNLINILSTPRILVLDNEEATINVGMDVPIVTGEQTTTGITQTGQVGIVRTYQYRTTGITLKVKPTINADGLLTLNITQEVSQAQQNTLSAVESPLILMRKINTTIVGPSGATVVLGGLIEENKSKTVSKVPLFGDIPLFGNLFKNTSEGVAKTELIILLTPRVLSTFDELLNVTESLKGEFMRPEINKKQNYEKREVKPEK